MQNKSALRPQQTKDAKIIGNTKDLRIILCIRKTQI